MPPIAPGKKFLCQPHVGMTSLASVAAACTAHLSVLAHALCARELDELAASDDLGWDESREVFGDVSFHVCAVH